MIRGFHPARYVQTVDTEMERKHYQLENGCALSVELIMTGISMQQKIFSKKDCD